jgi:hypothetical protein
MSNWKNTHISLGVLKENNSYSFEFESIEKLDVLSAKPGCGNCTSLEGYKDNKLKVTYKSNGIPYHLGKNKQPVNKTITITYQDGTTETLSFSGIIKK